jgi:hypothetical protein
VALTACINGSKGSDGGGVEIKYICNFLTFPRRRGWLKPDMGSLKINPKMTPSILRNSKINAQDSLDSSAGT